MQHIDVLTQQDRWQQQLVRHCYWDDIEQLLYIDARRIFPKIGVVNVIGWDAMMLNNEPIPSYPSFFKPIAWAKQGAFVDWLKQIPKWVQDSCRLFPSHQLTLLHYAGKYPQILELLDHAPMLAWQLIKSDLQEAEIVALLAGKRTQIAASVGWPGKAETIKFLTNLRLRWVSPEIAEQVEACLFDEQRLQALQDLPRVNSMALSLAARFPHLIGSRLHKTLAQLPCRPMQCQSMVAMLEDAYQLADFLGLESDEQDKIGECRYLVEVEKLYQQWILVLLNQAGNGHVDSCLDFSIDELQNQLTSAPQVLHQKQQWLALTELQQHGWLMYWQKAPVESKATLQLLAWQDEKGVWGALLDTKVLPVEQAVIKVRGLNNVLPSAQQLTQLHLSRLKA